MIQESLLAILRCPADEGELTLHDQSWLICHHCQRKYPIREEIPVMLISEGDRYREMDVAELPDPNQ